MGTVRLVSWNAAEAAGKAARLSDAGYSVSAEPPAGPGFLRELEALAPVAVVIDLDRLPSHGRDVALAIRERKGTRRLPLVFAGGAGEKVARVKEQLPDAVFTPWEAVLPVLAAAVASPPEAPTVPASRLAGYSGTPLPRKLGIKPGATVATKGAPHGLAATLGPLPEGARLRSGLAGRFDLGLFFVRSRAELERDLPRIAARLPGVPLWILWPKKAGPLPSDLGQAEVRARGLSAGLVDYKVCAFDDTFSGLLFRRRAS